MSAKWATSGFLEIDIFWKKVYGVLIFAHDIINKILSHDLNFYYGCGHVTKGWYPKYFHKRREVILTLFLNRFNKKKNNLFKDWT